MANTIAAFGFRPIGHLDGSQPTMGTERKFIASSDTNTYFTGDPVALSTTGPYITVPSSGTVQIYGIFVGCEFPNPTAGIQRTVWSPFFPGSVQTSSGTADATAYVISDPEQLFIAQVSSTAITSSQVGNNVGFQAVTSSLGNTTTGISNVSVGSTTVGTSSSLPFRIVDLYSNTAPPGGFVNGTDNTTNGNIIIVGANNWNRSGGTTGV